MDESEYLTAEFVAISAVRRLIADLHVQMPQSVRENSPNREYMLKGLDQVARNIITDRPTEISMRAPKGWENPVGSGSGSSSGDAEKQKCPNCGHEF